MDKMLTVPGLSVLGIAKHASSAGHASSWNVPPVHLAKASLIQAVRSSARANQVLYVLSEGRHVPEQPVDSVSWRNVRLRCCAACALRVRSRLEICLREIGAANTEMDERARTSVTVGVNTVNLIVCGVKR